MGLTEIDRAVVASAIQLARKRRARRALLVHRDGPIRKESSLSTQPVLEVGPRSDGDAGGKRVSDLCAVSRLRGGEA